MDASRASSEADIRGPLVQLTAIVNRGPVNGRSTRPSSLACTGLGRRNDSLKNAFNTVAHAPAMADPAIGFIDAQGAGAGENGDWRILRIMGRSTDHPKAEFKLHQRLLRLGVAASLQRASASNVMWSRFSNIRRFRELVLAALS